MHFHFVMVCTLLAITSKSAVAASYEDCATNIVTLQDALYDKDGYNSFQLEEVFYPPSVPTSRFIRVISEITICGLCSHFDLRPMGPSLPIPPPLVSLRAAASDQSGISHLTVCWNHPFQPLALAGWDPAICPLALHRYS